MTLADDGFGGALDGMLPAEFERVLANSKIPRQHLPVTGPVSPEQPELALRPIATDPLPG